MVYTYVKHFELFLAKANLRIHVAVLVSDCRGYDSSKFIEAKEI